MAFPPLHELKGRTLKGVNRLMRAVPEAASPAALKVPVLRLLATLVDGRKVPPPFFQVIHDLLDASPTLTLGELMDQAGEQVWGLTLLLLALLTFIPGVANVLSLATIVLGLQMLWGSPHPWMPGRLRAVEIHQGRVKKLLARIEDRLAWLGERRGSRRPPSQRFVGFLVAWTAFLAALPIPLPFANVLPATALILYGTALLEEWPLMAWMGVLLSLGTTAYFGYSFELAWKACKAMFHGVMG